MAGKIKREKEVVKRMIMRVRERKRKTERKRAFLTDLCFQRDSRL